MRSRLWVAVLVIALTCSPVHGQTGVSGTITAAEGAVTLSDILEWSSVWIQITGTWTQTLQFEGSVDGTNYFSVNGVVPTTAAVATSTAANGNWQINVGSLRNFRVRSSAFTSGTATVTVRASAGVGPTTPATVAAGAAAAEVQGTAADGAAAAGDPVQVGGVDGSGNMQRVLTDTTGAIQVDVESVPANQSVNVAQINGVATTMGNGVSGTGVQRVTLASDSTGQVTLAAGANTIGALTANQSVNAAQIAGTAAATGNGVVGAGVQRVAVASDNTAFTVNVGTFPDNEPMNVAQINGVTPLMGNGVTGTGSQRVTVASDNTAFTVNVGTFPDNEPINIAQIGGSAVAQSGGLQYVRVGNAAGTSFADANNVDGDGHVQTIAGIYTNNRALLYDGGTDMGDRQRGTDLNNYEVATTLTARNAIGLTMQEKGARWTVISNPAAGSQATASIAAEASVRHVVDCVSFSAGSTSAPALTALTINLRDGATGAGTIIWTKQVIIPAATGQNVEPFGLCGLNLTGTTNTAMTLEFSAALANLIQEVSISGFNVS